MSMYIELLQC